MKRQVARVNIYINPVSTESSVTADSRNGEFDITINQGEGKHAIKNVSDFQTTLAHELGHVIALLTKDPSHDTRQNFAARDDFGGTHQLNIGAEERAWQFAHDIWPDLNQKAEDWSLGTYREHKALVESGRVPRFQQYVTLPEPEPDDFTGRWEDDGGALWQNVVVYHGTTKTAAESIKREGLKPKTDSAFRLARTDWPPQVIETHELAYVTPVKAMAEAFARLRARYERAPQGALLHWSGLMKPAEQREMGEAPAPMRKLTSERKPDAVPAIVELALPDDWKTRLEPDPSGRESLGFVYDGTIPAEYVEDVQVLSWHDYLETRNLAPDLPRYTTPRDIAFYPEDAHSPTTLESHSPTFDKFMQDWAFQNAPVKAEPKPEPIEPMTTGQTIAAVLFLIALFSAASTIVGYALLGAIEVLR